jgi:hypothetical protein
MEKDKPAERPDDEKDEKAEPAEEGDGDNPGVPDGPGKKPDTP